MDKYDSKDKDHAAVLILVQVCYARAQQSFLYDLMVAEGTTLQQALEQIFLSGKLAGLDANPASMPLGIFGQVKKPDTVLRAGDRIEVYRPLKMDPKQMRRRRAQQSSK